MQDSGQKADSLGLACLKIWPSQ